MRAQLREVLSWVAWARDGGFDYLTTGQHFLSAPNQMLQQLPLLARLAPEAGDVGLVATVILPLHQPVELAELTATVDVITGGRLTVSASRGCRAPEFVAFGVPPAEGTARMVERLECLIGLWSGDEFGSCHLRMNWPGMPASLSRRSLERFAAEALPALWAEDHAPG